jgi:hypothetical protein
MQSIGFIAPLLPGTTETDRARHALVVARRAAAGSPGLAQPARYLPGGDVHPVHARGDVAVVYREAEDVEAVFKALATSDDPYDRWFRDHVREVHGINVEDGFPPSEQVMDLRVDRISRLDSEAV